MSTIKNIILYIICFVFSFSFSQEKEERNYTTIYVDLSEKSLESYHISKDTTTASFSIYFEKYESQKTRDMAIKEYNSKIKKLRATGISDIDPDLIRLPNFSITFTAFDFNEKPVKLKSIIGIKYITINGFRNDEYRSTNPMYIIHKLKNGTFLKWEVITMPEE